MADNDVAPKVLSRSDFDAVLAIVDDCLERDAGIEVILARVAEALGCPVGVEVSQGGLYAAWPDGSLRAEAAPFSAITRALPDDSRVWIDTARDSLGGDVAVLLRRLGVAAKVALKLTGHTDDRDADLRTAVDADADESTRLRALERLGFGGQASVYAFALYGDADAVSRFADQVRSRSSFVRTARLGRIDIVLARDLEGVVGLGVPVGLRASFAGPGPASDVPRLWRHARLALRFALPSPRDSGTYLRDEAVLNDSSSIGGYLLLAETLTVTQLAQVSDVRRLNHLVREQGTEMLVCLEAVAATDSLRKAAALLHLHHNSVANRVERAQRYLGFDVMERYGRNRLFIALVLRRLLESGRLFGS